MNILAIGAHPDDLDISCGGTLIRFAREGHHVTMCIATDGRAHPVGDPAAVAARRFAEASAAARLADAQLEWLGLPDGRLFDDFSTRVKFIDVILRSSPDLIITHAPDDYHADHIATSRIVTETVQMAWAPPQEAKGEPVHKAIPVAFMPPENGINFLPEEYVDVSEVWDTKIQMALCHRSQYLPGPDFDIPLSEPLDNYSLVRLTRIVDEFYGLQCWCKYAEAFRWWRAADRLVTRRLLPG